LIMLGLYLLPINSWGILSDTKGKRKK